MQTTLDGFWRFASQFCDEVQDFQPDVILVLMHSARMPFFAGEALWRTVSNQPLAPVVFTNLGREKITIFDETVQNPHGMTNCFIGNYESLPSQAFFLAWLASKTDWQEELRGQVKAQLGDIEPRRILIVDEFIHEGSTAILALGLLSLLYPKAKTRFIEADLSGWYEPILKTWAAQCQPNLTQTEIFRLPDEGEVFSVQWDAGKQMVIGSEDISANSLAWRDITSESPLMSELSAFLSVDAWLSLPGWDAEFVRAEITRRAADYLPGAAPRVQGYCLELSLLVLRDIFRYGAVSARDVAEMFGISPRQARRVLLKVMDDGYLIVEKNGAENRYRASPMVDSEYGRTQGPILDAYWAIPEQLLIGDMPGWDMDSGRETLLPRLDWLLEQGVTFFLDFSEHYTHKPVSYQKVLMARARELGKKVTYCAMPTSRQKLPARARILEMVKTVQSALRDGQVVYIHSLRTGGIEAVIAGCLLVEGGMSGQKALETLNQARAGLRDGWRHAPYTETGRRCVRHWRKNDYT